MITATIERFNYLSSTSYTSTLANLFNVCTEIITDHKQPSCYPEKAQYILS